MTSFLLALALIFAPVVSGIQDPAPKPGTGLISGVVTSTAGSRPIPNAAINIVQWVGGLGKQMPARTDAQGRFTLKDLPAGSYDVTARADGHVSLRYGQRATTDGPKRIELADGQQFTEADIVLPKFTAIEGQLIDEFGEPVPGVLVAPMQVAFLAGKTRLTTAPGTNSVQPTDDRGVFRIYGLAPGDYYLAATTGPFAGPTNPPGFAVTFYPGTANPQNAKAVHLDTGHDTLGVSFAMTPAPMSTVSGAVFDAEGKPVRGDLRLFGLSGGDVRSSMSAVIASEPDGRFTMRNVAPGSYVLQAYGRPAPGAGNLGRSPFGATVFDVAGDRDDLRLVIKGVRMTGRVLFEGTSPAPPVDRVLLNMASAEFVTSPAGGGPPAMTMNPDWTFEILNMSGQRLLRPVVGAPGWTLKSVVVDGKDMTDVPIDFRNIDKELTGVEVTLTTNSGSIKGTVTGKDGPATDSTIVAFADDPSKWTVMSRFMAVARPNAKGEFTLAGLPAGDYLVAVPPPGTSPLGADPAVLEGLRKTAVRVNVQEGASASVTLTIK